MMPEELALQHRAHLANDRFRRRPAARADRELESAMVVNQTISPDRHKKDALTNALL